MSLITIFLEARGGDGGNRYSGQKLTHNNDSQSAVACLECRSAEPVVEEARPTERERDAPIRSISIEDRPAACVQTQEGVYRAAAPQRAKQRARWRL
jgi:hypothetical protein